MASYQFVLMAPKQYNTEPLKVQLIAAGIPVDYINGDPSTNSIVVVTTRDLTTDEVNTAAGIVATYDGRPRRARTIYAIYAELATLTQAQRDAIWADLSAGNPPKLALDAGPNTASVFTMHFLGASVGGLTAAEKNEAKRRGVAFYVQDNPAYLVRPSFAPTVNVAGDEAYDPPA